MKKAIILSTLAVATVVGTGYFATTHAYAQDGQAPYESLIQKIADKFHLNKDEVKAVFDQNKQEHMAKRQDKVTDHLDKLVRNCRQEKIIQDHILHTQHGFSSQFYYQQHPLLHIHYLCRI